MPGQYNPETILEEQFESQRQQIQKQFQFQWDEVNNKARAGLYKSQKERDGAFFEIHSKAAQVLGEFDQKAEQATGQLKMVTDLAEQGFIKDPDEVKWRMVLGPEAERGMFPPEPRDPRDEYREITTTEDKILYDVQQFALGNDKKLYYAKIDKEGWATDQPDRSKPASQEDYAAWVAGKDALYSLRQAKTEAAQNMAAQGIEDPDRLQNLLKDKEKESWLEKHDWVLPLDVRRVYKPAAALIKELRKQPSGTFAQKVQRDIAPSLKQQPKQLSRSDALAEYRKLGGSRTSEGRAYADRNLR